MAPLTLSPSRALQLFQVMRLGSGLLTSVLLAKSGLSLEAIGVYELLLYLGGVATFFWLNGLLQGLPPMYARLAKKKDRKAFLQHAFLAFSAVSALVCGALWLGESAITPLLTGRPELEHYGLFCLYLLFNLPTYPVEYFYLLRDRPLRLVSWGAANLALHLVAVYVPIRLGYGLHGSVLALVTVGAIKFVWTLGLALSYGRLRWIPGLLRGYLRFSLPLVVNAVIANLVLLFDQWLVGWWYAGDDATFAVFRYGSREFPLATALATALGVAMIPRLTTDPGQGRAELRARTARLFHVLFPLTILLLFLTRPLFPVVFNPELAAAAPLFNIYLLMTASRVLLPNSLVLARGAPRVILWVGLAELAVKILLGFLFIRWWGLYGVAWSAVAAFWVEKLALMWWLEKRAGVRTREWVDERVYLGYVAALGAAYWAASVI
jgi:O-antigen/teichoic acid export membrane protein